MKIAVLGTGYVGLVTGACLSEYKHRVYCVDIDLEKIEKLKQGIISIYEPSLEEIVVRNTKRNLLFFTNNLKEAIDKSDYIFLCLGTPNDDNGKADLSAIYDTCRELSKIINTYKIIITKSTVPVGTADTISKIFSENSSVKVDVVSNPEFLREGHAVEDFMKPERIVIGYKTEKVKEKMEELYFPYRQRKTPIYFMDNRSAELVKYACNTFLALKICFVNEMANLCEILKANYSDVRDGLGSDTRIGEKFLAAGIGYGGSCFPKRCKCTNSYSTRRKL